MHGQRDGLRADPQFPGGADPQISRNEHPEPAPLKKRRGRGMNGRGREKRERRRSDRGFPR